MRRILINDAGAPYLKAVLSGETGLCARLIKCPLENGNYSTFVPDGTKIYDVTKPHSGGLLFPKEAEKVFVSFPAYLRTVNVKARAGTLIVQSPWSQPSDAVPRDLDDEHLLQAGFGVCHSCKIADLSESEFDFLIGDTIAMNYVACIVSPDFEMTTEYMSTDELFCHAVIAVFVPAYDGESILMWEKD